MKYVCLRTYETPKLHAAYPYRYGCCCYDQHHFAIITENPKGPCPRNLFLLVYGLIGQNPFKFQSDIVAVISITLITPNLV
jgi:hypothetical protein